MRTETMRTICECDIDRKIDSEKEPYISIRGPTVEPNTYPDKNSSKNSQKGGGRSSFVDSKLKSETRRYKL